MQIITRKTFNSEMSCQGAHDEKQYCKNVSGKIQKIIRETCDSERNSQLNRVIYFYCPVKQMGLETMQVIHSNQRYSTEVSGTSN